MHTHVHVPLLTLRCSEMALRNSSSCLSSCAAAVTAAVEAVSWPLSPPVDRSTSHTRAHTWEGRFVEMGSSSIPRPDAQHYMHLSRLDTVRRAHPKCTPAHRHATHQGLTHTHLRPPRPVGLTKCPSGQPTRSCGTGTGSWLSGSPPVGGGIVGCASDTGSCVSVEAGACVYVPRRREGCTTATWPG